MTHAGALPSFALEPSESGFPPVRPRWLGPVTTTAVVLAHLALGMLFMNFALEKIVPLDEVGVDLIPEGDQFESVEQVEMDEVPPPEAFEQPDFAIPPPLIMHPDAPPLPAKNEVTEQQKRVVEKRREVQQAGRKQQAQERHRLGIEGGQAASGGLSRASYAALLSAAIRRHVPSSTTLGPGTATCSFHVSMGGGMTGVSCSGSSPAHASLLRMAIASVQAPPPPGGGFFAAQAVNFH
jgi:periplasmic protein TonB